MTVIRKIFGNGQVTLPQAWREKLTSSVVQMTIENDRLIIKAVPVDEYETIFESKDFGFDEGMPVKDFLSALKEVNHGTV